MYNLAPLHPLSILFGSLADLKYYGHSIIKHHLRSYVEQEQQFKITNHLTSPLRAGKHCAGIHERYLDFKATYNLPTYYYFCRTSRDIVSCRCLSRITALTQKLHKVRCLIACFAPTVLCCCDCVSDTVPPSRRPASLKFE